MPGPSGDSITAYPDLDPKGLEDLVTNCPKMLGGKDVPLGPNDPALLQLQKARLNAALAQSAIIMDRVKAGQLNDALALPEACDRAASAAADVFAANEARPWFEERVRVAKWYEKVIGAQAKGGKKGPADLNAARYARLEAEIALMKLTSPTAGGR